MALMGVDIGTTNLKAVVFAPDGRELAKATTPTQTEHPQADWAQLNYEVLWTDLARIIREAACKLPDTYKLSAVAFTGMAEAGVPIDASGNVLYPAITWYDRRVLPQLQRWQESIGSNETAQITGLPMAPMAGILRPMWLRDHAPDVFRRMQTWLNLPDYAAYRLCGSKVTEYSLASRMMVLDLGDARWSQALLDKAELDHTMLGELAPSGTMIGRVNKSAADETGLPVGLPVCTGGHDHLCAAVGLGVIKPGDLFDSIGTAEAVVATLSQRNQDPAIASVGIAQGLHVVPGRYYAISGNAYGGGSIDWVRRLLMGAVIDQSLTFESLIERAGKVAPGSDGVFFLPHLRQANPPIIDPSSRGAFVGLSSGTESGQLSRAVLEGVAYELQRILDSVSECFSVTNRRLVAAGGGTRNRLLMQIKADVSGLPIVIPAVDEATCLGAALAAGIGAGVYRDFKDALDRVAFSEQVIEPDQPRHELYRERYEKVFVRLYDSLRDVNHEISRWVRSDHTAH